MIDLNNGSELSHQGRAVRVLRPRTLETICVEDIETGRASDVPINQLLPALSEIPEQPAVVLQRERQEDAEHRFDLIAPLLTLWPRPRTVVEARAREVGISTSQLYRLLRAYQQSGQVEVLARQGRSDQGQMRLDPEVVALMDTVIQAHYLTKQQVSMTETYEEVCARCQVLKLKPPSRNSLVRRIQKIAPMERLRRRRGARAAQHTEPIRGSVPGAFAPLDVVQIDHTPLDVIIVDDHERQDIGRPFLTVVIDVMSRVVLGFHVSLDHPSFMGTGACLAQAILPKEALLTGREQRLREILAEATDTTLDDDFKLSWPVWGKPTKVLADNAREFRGAMMERACHAQGIHVELRPVKKPHYGGHIERLMGTVAQKVHTLPGTTFSNPKARGEYKSGKEARLTFEELELWLTVFFAGIYNHRPHGGLKGGVPIQVYQQALFRGTAESPPKGLAPRMSVEEALKLRIDFLPSFEITVQRTGITLETVTYYHELLEPYLARRVLGQPSEKFVVRRDPRDLSQVYFYAEEVGRYFAIPFANTMWRRMSVWELRELKQAARTKPGERVDEDMLIRAQQTMRWIEKGAAKTTKKTRRGRARKAAHDVVEPPMLPEPRLMVSLPDQEDIEIVPYSVIH